MDIKKADSKGRVSGFTPGGLYAFDREKGYFSPVIIKDPAGRPVEEALRFDTERLEELTRSAADTLYNLGDGAGRDNDLTWEEAEKYARAIFQMLRASRFEGYE